MKHVYYWSCLAGFALAFLLDEASAFDAAPLSDHMSNFFATGLATTLVVGRSGFHRWTPPILARAATVTVAFMAIELLADGPLYVYETESVKLLGFINTADPVDALIGLAGGLTVIALIRVASRRSKASAEADDAGGARSGG